MEAVIHAIFLDIKKAFDKVCLLYKLHESDIQGQTFQWIANFLNTRKQAVVVENQDWSLKGQF